MSRLVLAFIATAILTACGADGIPQRPTENAAQPTGTGVSLSGSARVGVVYGPPGASKDKP
ncbi:MAG: hypothetical protein ACI92Z_000255 [Paracoccaceae bacterium]|jgi:hypothetical protein